MKKNMRGSAGSDLILFIFFIIVLGIIWAVSGGPGRSISTEGPFLNPPWPLGDSSAYTVPSVPIPSGEDSPEDKEESGGFADIISRAWFDLGIGNTDEEKSPHAEYVSLSRSSARNDEPDEEYVTIKTSRNLEGQLRISEWRIESTATLSGATLGDAAYLPYSGQVNTELPVAVGPNTTIYVVTGRSPIGTSFRTNTCTGYFVQFQDFEPRLDRDCPAPIDELGTYIDRTGGFIPSDTCIDYVENLDRCTLNINIPANLSGVCRDFVLNELTYNGCVNNHKNDVEFYKNEWRMYLGRDQELWKNTRERIRLLDENGLVIDVISY